MDDKNRHNAILEIFNAALALEPEQREAFLISACAGDAALRSEVLALISADKRSEGFLSGPLTIAAVSPTGEPSGSLTGQSFGQYQILELLGKGGMGEFTQTPALSCQTSPSSVPAADGPGVLP